MKKINLSESEKREIFDLLNKGQAIPEKYRFVLFGDEREVELIWNGKNNTVSNVVLPFQHIEQIDEPRENISKSGTMDMFDFSGKQISGWTNKLIWGDNKLILSSLKNGPMRKEIEKQGGLKLIYIDPPFDVGADFSIDIQVGEGEDEKDFTKKPSVIEEIAYRDTWGKGADSFIAMIYERLKLMHGLLAEDGSIYVHCDWRLSGYTRLVLDEIFGKDNFKNEIVWTYNRLSNKGKIFVSTHDTIFFYSKSDKYIFNQLYLENSLRQEQRLKRGYDWGRFGELMVYDKSKVLEKIEEEKLKGNKIIYVEVKGKPCLDIFDIPVVNTQAKELVSYPTQKPEALLERIIKASTNEGDLVADFFCGSGTTLAVAEKLGRKWIGTDLGKFGIHTTRKRMIGIQRELKKNNQDFRAFEILNLGKYERESFVKVNMDIREEHREKQRAEKEKQFIKLIIQAYKAEEINGFKNMVAKKRDSLVAIGPINLPVSEKFILDIIDECKENNIRKVDILGFDYEMGIDRHQFKNDKDENSVNVNFKIIPKEVFDKRAVEKGQVQFYDISYIEINPIIKKSESDKKMKTIEIELANFSVFYNQENNTDDIKNGRSKIMIDNGEIIEVKKDKDGVESRNVLTKKWSDWIDYWAVDFNFTNKKEIIKVQDEEGNITEEWSGDYIFDNEWQSFRTKKNRNIELISAKKEVVPGKYKIAIKVVDIFGNDTTKVIDVEV